jgi:hypothetical protein
VRRSQRRQATPIIDGEAPSRAIHERGRVRGSPERGEAGNPFHLGAARVELAGESIGLALLPFELHLLRKTPHPARLVSERHREGHALLEALIAGVLSWVLSHDEWVGAKCARNRG